MLCDIERTWRRIALGLAALLLAAPVQARPLSPAQFAMIDDAAMKALAATGAPAASVAIVQDGRIVYARAYGQQRQGQPARRGARYPIGSVSKQFTAAAILLLADEGRLSLDDRVGKYLPTLTRANDITIRQLLSHTSGYRDYWPQDYVFPRMTRPATPGDILDTWARAPLDFEPGTRWQYSNTGYVAAGQIVEKVSGQPLFAFLKSRIFDRLDMKVVEEDTGLTSGDPLGYVRYALGPVRVGVPSAKGWTYAAGSLAMTASDLARWDISIIDRSLMSRAAYAAQQREEVLTTGLGTDYGLGVDIADVGGHRRISHGGAVMGFLTDNRVYPDDRAAIVVLQNADFGHSEVAIADAIEEQLFADDSGVARARALYAMLRAGRIDRAAFTANGNAYFTPLVLGDYRASLTPLGEPRSFVQTRSSLRGGLTVERYLLDFGGRKLVLTLRAEPGTAGKVEEFFLSSAT